MKAAYSNDKLRRNIKDLREILRAERDAIRKNKATGGREEGKRRMRSKEKDKGSKKKEEKETRASALNMKIETKRCTFTGL